MRSTLSQDKYDKAANQMPNILFGSLTLATDRDSAWQKKKMIH